MSSRELPHRILKSSAFGIDPSSRLPFSGALHIIRVGEQLQVIGTPPLFPIDGPTYRASLAASPQTIQGQVEALVAYWHEHVINRVVRERRRFLAPREKLPFRQPLGEGGCRAALIEEVLAGLAVAGNKLYWHIFGGNTDGALVELRETLEEGLRTEQTLRFISDDVAIPWPLLYTHPVAGERLSPNGSNFRASGFWGYQHVLDHEVRNTRGRLLLSADANGRLPFGAHMDQRLIAELSGVAPDYTSMLLKLDSLRVAVRTDRRALEAVARHGSFDAAMYFLCHGEQHPHSGEPGLCLTDGAPITKGDLDYWLQGNDLDSESLVFLNTCRGGALKTWLFETVARGFLGAGAAGVVGSFIDLPVYFAADYAYNFFSRFAPNGTQQAAFVGPVMRSLTRRYLDEFDTPLGLAYSCYRAAGCSVTIDA